MVDVVITCPYCEYTMDTCGVCDEFDAIVCESCKRPFLSIIKMFPEPYTFRVLGVDDNQNKNILSQKDVLEDFKIPPEPDTLEQMRAGERRLRELYPYLRLFFSTKKMTSEETEYTNLQNHLEEMMKQLTGADKVSCNVDRSSVWYVVSTYENKEEVDA